MSNLNWLRRIRERLVGQQEEPSDLEAARESLQNRYQALRLLLSANTKALELMAAMERAALGGPSFGMPFVRSHCTAIGVSVFQMVRNLDVLAPGKYTVLFDRLQDIQREIDEALAVLPTRTDIALVMPISEIDHDLNDVAGSKMANLGEVANLAGMKVPKGFVVTAAAYERLLETNDLQPEIDRLLLAHQPSSLDELYELSSEIQALVRSAKIPEDIVAAISLVKEDLELENPNIGFAVRSSALGEDSPGSSFAGQYESILNVRPEHLLESYLEVVAGKYTPQAMHYRIERGLRDEDVSMSVGFLEMVDAHIGGVCYTGNPSDRGEKNVFICSAWGLPKAIVDGRFGSDLTVIEREPPHRLVRSEIGIKEIQFVMDPSEGVQRAEVPEDLRHEPSLTEAAAREVAELSLTLDAHFGSAVDVEWAINKQGDVVVLQCRPLVQSQTIERRMIPEDAPPPLAAGGFSVSPGTAAGIVHWVRRDSDALACPEQAVLVLEQPLPRWAALIGRAAAVVAASGGVAGHLATVAREFGVPAVFGVVGLDALINGLEITVDSGRTSVYPGRIESILETPVPSPRAMDNSPVFDTLRQALRHIAPLNLIDPDGLDFIPSRCRTLHDITRFCHEQSVREIFSYGAENVSSEFAGKQLHHNVPMQWWVLDLEDGFKQPVGRYVKLEDIACTPMLALWDGMVAVPWAGPPAATGRGMMSVLFEATANPALSNPFKKPYGDRNYFIISRHFVNLQSRFGFHFSNVEALAGPRPEENYLSFSFRGGAADLERKAARATFIGGLLRDFNFVVEVIDDLVTARRMGLSGFDVEQALRIVGYLLMHTRQLDMVMGQKPTVERYRIKMRSEIEGIISSKTLS